MKRGRKHASHERILHAFDVSDYFDDPGIEALDIKQLSRDESQLRAVDGKIAGLPVFGENRSLYHLFKIASNGHNSQEIEGLVS